MALCAMAAKCFINILWQILINIWQTLNIINEGCIFFKTKVKEGFVK